DYSTLPASILKDGPSDEEQQQSDERSERRKSRKSLNRRVSFAPTAHVRMFEIPEEKQRTALGNNMYEMPDLSSQTGMLGFNLGAMSTVEEASMTSNESFDVSVRHSDPSESLQSSGGSFAQAANTAEEGAGDFGVQAQGGDGDQVFGNILDDEDEDDEDDDLDDVDGDDDAVTMELTGTVDMGAIRSDDDDDDDDDDEDDSDEGNMDSGAHREPAPMGLTGDLTGQVAQTVDAQSFFNMLLQGNGNSSTEQSTSLLDNIISQFGQDQLFSGADTTAHSAVDAEVTRVGMAAGDDDQDTTVHMGASGGQMEDSGDSDGSEEDSDDDDDDASNENEDAITMELTGIMPRRGSYSESADSNSSNGSNGSNDGVADQGNPFTISEAEAVSAIWNAPMASTFMDTIGTLLSAQQPGVLPISDFLANNADMPTLTPEPVVQEELVGTTPATPRSVAPVTPRSAAPLTPRSVLASRQAATPKARTPGSRLTPKQLPSATPLSGRRTQKTLKPSTPATPVPVKEPTFVLDLLPPMPAAPRLPVATVSSGPPTLVAQAKAGLVLDVFSTYHRQQLVPEPLSKESESEFPAKFEPLYRKAQLTARLEYCSALNGLFEADRVVSEAVNEEPVQLDSLVSFFGVQNEALAQQKRDLLVRIARAKQRLAQEALSSQSESGETHGLRVSLGAVRAEREAIKARVEALGAEVRELQATCTTHDRRLTEKKSAQGILLAINGLSPSEASEEACSFVYDRFAKLHVVGDAAEFTSLHPDIDWSAIIRASIPEPDSLTMRQYTLAVMQANVVLKGLLEDVRRVKQHTFVEIQQTEGIQIRMQFFSRKMRRRFHLLIPLASVESYARLHEETEFEWPADVVYGAVDLKELKRCLATCNINPSAPVLSIYQHVDASMEAF
ncbi:hypothetical protein IWW50_002758, partial [Coemansia erecta]